MRDILLRHLISSASLLALLSIPVVAAAQEPGLDQGQSVYLYAQANQEGIGKTYMGREISYVMGHQGAQWLERPDREREERTDLLIENLPIEAGDKVADIGAGTGYFSFPMADIVGAAGKVYAVDIQPEMLTLIEDRAASEGVTNIELVLATDKDPQLAEASINLALFVDAYHEFEWPFEVMSAIYTSLVPGGKVVLIEYRAEDRRVPIKILHKMSEQQARAEMAAVGLVFVENRDMLPQQHMLIFEKPL